MPETKRAPRFTPTQLAGLVVLMAEARELSNNELDELAGVRLTGREQQGLIALGLIVSRPGRNRLQFHQLTDKGWQTCKDLTSGDRPKITGPAGRALYVLLESLQRSLAESRLSPGDFFLPTIEQRIRSAYLDRNSEDEWLSLADIRELLPAIDRTDLDAELRRLAQLDDVHIFPVANSKSLSKREREASLRIGGDDSYALKIGDA